METYLQGVMKNSTWRALFACAVVLGASPGNAQTLTSDFRQNLDGTVYSLAVAPDGRLLIAGDVRAARILNPDGTLNRLFDAVLGPGRLGSVSSFAVQPDGKFALVGGFSALGPAPVEGIARFTSSGEVDPSLASPFIKEKTPVLLAIARTSDGKFLVGGYLGLPGGASITNMARLETTGELDAGFHVSMAAPPNGFIEQADGGALVLAGDLDRITRNGMLDPGFTRPAITVDCAALQADGKILVAGSSQSDPYHLTRLESDGSEDPSFKAQVNGLVGAIAAQADGKIVIGGNFTEVNGVPRQRLARLNPDGSLDTAFEAPPQDVSIWCMAIQKNGKILLGGTGWVGRLNNTEAATETLSSDRSAITWMRGGSGPQATRVSFQWSSNGVDWVDAGAAQRVAGG